MDSRTGKDVRLSRVLRPATSRGVVVATSHGVLTGPPGGQRTREEIDTLFAKLRAADAVMVAPGMLRRVEHLYLGRDSPGLVVELDWKSWNRPIYPPLVDGRSEGTCAPLARCEDLAAAGVDAVMTYLYVGHEDQRLERDEVERNARIARECERWGIGLIIEPRSAREGLEDHARAASTLAFYCRLAAEIGADIVKCVWPGSADAFSEVTSTCFAPVLLAGGPGEETPDAAARLAREAVDAGGSGVMFGRKIYRSPDPERTLAALLDAVHDEERSAS